MADNEQEGGAGDGAEAAAPKGKLRLIIIVIGALAVLSGGAASWFLFFNHHDEERHAEAAAPPAKPPSFVDVPDMLVNLVSAPGERVQYLRVKIVLEVKEEKQIEAIKPAMPRVTDIFQTYMRELRAADLNGSAGPFPPKGEAAHPGKGPVAARSRRGGVVQGNRGSVARRIFRTMAGNDPVDQDAIAAQWEASLGSEDPAEAADAAEANKLTESMALQWAAMVEDGSRDFGTGKNNGERVL